MYKNFKHYDSKILKYWVIKVFRDYNKIFQKLLYWLLLVYYKARQLIKRRRIKTFTAMHWIYFYK